MVVVDSEQTQGKLSVLLLILKKQALDFSII
jgi:hypothetical protein